MHICGDFVNELLWWSCQPAAPDKSCSLFTGRLEMTLQFDEETWFVDFQHERHLRRPSDVLLTSIRYVCKAACYVAVVFSD